ncbi:MAG TPA: adenylate/guanylate cyclase domain-containing protein [Xanthobacteraceae bacterium]|nr:adenylate/guanylate cyclase domain-containing protein [Xanthobacteraceae bacterium]
MRRKLAVILASDVAAYSRLVAADEEDTISRFRAAAAAFAESVRHHRGRVFNTAGDAILAEFASAVDATRCAIEIQQANNAANAAAESAHKLLFRIGIAIGDVLVCDNGDLLGDGVNIAARLEGIAEPGGICISEDVRVHVSNKINSEFVDLGEQKLKNIPRGIRAYRLGAPSAKEAPKLGIVRGMARRRWLAWTATAAVLLAGTASVLWVRRAPQPSPMTASAAINHSFDSANVPLVTDRVRSSLADYDRQPDFKAIAISHIGWGVSSGLPDQVGAERDALDRCKKRDPKGDCRIYAVGNEVVWPRMSLPLPADLHTVPLDVLLQAADIAVVKGMPSAAGLATYLAENNHKALAIAESGFSSMANRSDAAEAIRLAVERCSDFAKSPCLLVSFDGFLTVRVPHSYGTVRPYTLAGETEMSDADKAQIAQVYAGADWRALARGGSGHWYAVGAADSEAAAAEQVLAKCHQAEAQCGLRAIGNFRVDRK